MRWLLSWRYISSLHSTDESQKVRNSCPLLRSCFIGSCHVCCLKTDVFHVVSALQFIVFTFLFLLACAQLSYSTHAQCIGDACALEARRRPDVSRSVYRMRPLEVTRFSLQIQCSSSPEESSESTNHNHDKFTFILCLIYPRSLS